jgi:hypothetical protein
MTSHDGRSRKATRKIKSTKEQKMKSLKFFKPALATMLGILLAWLLSVRAAEAGYTITLQQVGPDIVATGSGAIDLTGLSIVGNHIPTETDIEPANGGIFTGKTALSDVYQGTISGPRRFGIGRSATYTNNASGDMVGIYAIQGNVVVVQPAMSPIMLYRTLRPGAARHLQL